METILKWAIKIICISGHQESPGEACYEKLPEHLPYSHLLFLNIQAVPSDFKNIYKYNLSQELNSAIQSQSQQNSSSICKRSPHFVSDLLKWADLSFKLRRIIRSLGKFTWLQF